MIKEKFVSVSVTNRTKNRYKDLGYDIENKSEIEIDPNHLTKSSHVKITAICDIVGCENETILTYDKYLKNKERCGYYGCKKCSQKKREEICLKVDGITYSEKLKKSTPKKKATLLERYGDENYNNIEKYRKTCNEKYGKDYALSVESIREKGKKTKLELYGNEYYTNIEQRITTKRINLLEKYRDWYPNLDIVSISDDRVFTIYCPKCKENYEIIPKNIYNRINYKIECCIICNPLSKGYSGSELEMLRFIESVYAGKIEHGNTTVLDKRKELDIYLLDKKIAFEYNGVYWHNELYKDDNYHLNKTEECERKGIRLIHVYEDEWLYKQDIVKSRISNILNINTKKIYARKTTIRVVGDNKLIRNFLDKNHIQGFCASSIKLGLYHEEELVSIMTFGKLRKVLGQSSKEGSFELLRFCNELNTSVVGGASKLFKYFIKNYNFNEILSYADRSWSTGNLYETLEFNLVSKTKPNYHYVVGNIREHRFKYRKDVLVREGYDENSTEHNIMLSRNIYRIYNSGNLKYIYYNNKNK